MVNQGGEKGNGMKFLAVTNCSTCVLPQWGGYKYVTSFGMVSYAFGYYRRNETNGISR